MILLTSKWNWSCGSVAYKRDRHKIVTGGRKLRGNRVEFDFLIYKTPLQRRNEDLNRGKRGRSWEIFPRTCVFPRRKVRQTWFTTTLLTLYLFTRTEAKPSKICLFVKTLLWHFQLKFSFKTFPIFCGRAEPNTFTFAAAIWFYWSFYVVDDVIGKSSLSEKREEKIHGKTENS